MTNEEKWNEIVRLYYVYKNVKEETIQKLWEDIFREVFGFSGLLKEIDNHRNIHLGSVDKIIPDIILMRDNKDLFVTELKQYNIGIDVRYERQLFSYLKQIKCNVGLLICNKIYIYYYDYTKDDNNQSRIEIPFENGNKDGIKFIELFSRDNFEGDIIKEYINRKIEMINNINNIKEKINSDYVLGLIKESLLKVYSEEEVNKAISQISINISLKTNVTAPIVEKKYKREYIIDKSSVGNANLERIDGENIQDWIKRVLLVLERDNLLTEQEIDNLQNLDYCKDNLGIAFPLFVSNYDDTVIAGHSRYWVKWPGKNEKYLNRFYVCSQWWKELDNKYEYLIDKWINKLTSYNNKIKNN